MLRRVWMVWAVSAAAMSAQQGTAGAKLPQCRRAVLEGQAQAGQAFQAPFARGLVFLLEPLRSGWVVRVLAAAKPREGHDYAEIATLPYQSVSPLLVSTDWAFRAQDAVGWNPRRFHYAADDAAFRKLTAQYDGVLRGEAQASAAAAVLAEAQPEALLEIQDARLQPGTADQTRMAAAVSSRFTETPHTVDASGPATALGRLEGLRFRVSFDLPGGLAAEKGVTVQTYPCPQRPTGSVQAASEGSSKRTVHK